MSPSETFQMPALPEVGTVPETMIAQVVRQDRFGDPVEAFRIEELPVPELGAREVLVAVMAAGINYNNVWAARGHPDRRHQVSACAEGRETEDFHIGGSDCSGIVYAVGKGVEGDRGRRRGRHPLRPVGPRRSRGSRRASDPMFAPPPTSGATRRTGALRPVHQGPGPPVPAEGGAPDLGGGRGVHAGRRDGLPHAPRLGAATCQPRATWCSSGAARAGSARRRSRSSAQPARSRSPSSPATSKGEYCKKLGADGWIDRTRVRPLGHAAALGTTPPVRRVAARRARVRQGVLGGRSASAAARAIVFEHPGEDTVPTSIFLVRDGRHGRDLRRHHRLQRDASTSATTGCARSACRARTSRTTSRRAPTTTSSARARSTPAWVRSCPSRRSAGPAMPDMDAGALPPENTAILVNADVPGRGSTMNRDGIRRFLKPRLRRGGGGQRASGAGLQRDHADARCRPRPVPGQPQPR